MKTGHIRITDKVYFEYCNYNLCENYNTLFGRCKYFNGYCDEKEKYEASKRLVEVDNVLYQYEGDRKIYYIIFDISKYSPAFDNVSCKAELNLETATIIELL